MPRAERCPGPGGADGAAAGHCARGRRRLTIEDTDEWTWEGAWRRASALLEGAERFRVRGGEPGVEIALLDWGGEGDLVLLHHANGFCGATLAPIAAALADRYRVVAVDARGHGHSTSVAPGGDPDPYAWSTMASDLGSVVHQVLERVGCDRVALGIGHSFGGALSLEAAEKEPELFARLLLLDPVIIDAAPPADPGAVQRGPDLAAGALRRRDRFASRAEAFEHFRGRGIFADFTPEALALYVGEGIGPSPEDDFRLRCRPEVEAAIFSTGHRTDLFEDAPRVKAEVRFLHALRGNFSRERYDALAARMPSARVESLDVGHLFPLEEPDRVLALLDEWMPRP